jgi:hypothetical protein
MSYETSGSIKLVCLIIIIICEVLKVKFRVRYKRFSRNKQCAFKGGVHYRYSGQYV